MDEHFDAHARRNEKLKASGNPFADGVACVAGEYVPLAEARIPLLDQGFLHSDLTYDVPAVWDGRFFRLDDHLERLWQSCAKMRLVAPLDRATVRATLIEMVAKSGIRDAFVEIIVTRGFNFVRESIFHERGEPKPHAIYMLVMPYVWAFPPEVQKVGGSAIVARTVRRTPPGAMDPTIKNLQWGDFTRALMEAQDRGSFYPILTDGDANITEGSGYNVFVVKDGALLTPSRGVLQGVTRRTTLEIAEANGMRTVVDHIPVSALYDCDEIFLTTTAGGVMPITELDGQRVGGGQVGPVSRKIWESYWAAHYDPKLSFEIDYG